VSDEYDVVVIGTGAGGGTLANTLAPSGKRILVLERGNFLTRELENWDPGEVMVNSEVVRLQTDASGRTVTGVVVSRDGGRAQETFRGSVVVLAAGAANSAKILLNSASDAHPAGLANGSDHVHLNYTSTNDVEADGLYGEFGTCRFGTDPATSVLDINCKAHEVDNLYVTDTSFFPSIVAVNPALTAMANAIRVGEHISERIV
jgi:choline dehydrogenase-like flavoprotein